MLPENSHKSSVPIINEIRSLVLAGSKPCDVLQYLAAKVVDRDNFVNYMVEAFPQNDGDVWVVASRWINNNISERAANHFLVPVFEQFIADWRAENRKE